MRKFVKTLKLTRLLRGYYFEFIKTFRTDVREVGAETLDFVLSWGIFMEFYDELDKIMRPIQKSSMTPELVELDVKRDKIYRQLKGNIKSYVGNFEAAKDVAARRLMEVFDTYGNLTYEGQTEETGDIYNAVADMRNRYSTEITALGLTAWVTELDKVNKEFENLWNERNTRLNNEQPLRKFEEVRKDLNYYYELFMNHLEWQMNHTPSEAVKKFVYGWNGVIQKYKNIIAQHEGILDAEKEEEIEEDN